jgi:hypothetical protein
MLNPAHWSIGANTIGTTIRRHQPEARIETGQRLEA